MIPVFGFGVNLEKERWVFLRFSQSRTTGAWKLGPLGCCQQAHSLTFCGGSTEWNQVFFQLMPECIGRPTGHLPLPHRWGFGWPSTKQLCWEPQVAAHACAQASSCMAWLSLARWTSCPSAPLPQLLLKPGHSRGWTEGKPKLKYTKKLLLWFKKQSKSVQLSSLSI